jgi:hypothetical protein
MRHISKLTTEEMLEILCAPRRTDEPKESDFIPESETDKKAEEIFIENWLEMELN